MGVVEEKKQIDEQINENNNQPNVEEFVEKIDYKMVTFSLAGKDYGIDIMKVKEISKARDFTYVPNTSSFVRGVYNLRGDIISVIDLRMMFNLINEKSKDGSVENMIILRVEDHVIGILVDSINKVVGIPSSRIQPPHPLFGDINIKYIKGVVENAEKLYIILDVDRIFTEDEAEVVFTEAVEDEELSSLESIEEEKGSGLNFNFITETLATFKSFYVTRFNDTWVSSRFEEWTKIKGDNPEDIQLKSAEEADEYLSNFYSPGTGTFLTGEYLKDLKSLLSKVHSSNISIWNPGCGKALKHIL